MLVAVDTDTSMVFCSVVKRKGANAYGIEALSRWMNGLEQEK